MKFCEIYKDWVRFLKKRGDYGYYLYTLGRVHDEHFYLSFGSKKIPAKKVMFIQPKKINLYRTLPDTESLTYPLLMLRMKRIDERATMLSKLYHQNYSETVFSKTICWYGLAKEFYIEHLINVYGEDAVNRMFQRMLRKKEETRRKKEEERNKWLHWWDDYEVVFDPPRVETAETRVNAGTYTTQVRRRREEEVRGQWYDQVYRNRLRRQDRWRLRR